MIVNIFDNTCYLNHNRKHISQACAYDFKDDKTELMRIFTIFITICETLILDHTLAIKEKLKEVRK